MTLGSLFDGSGGFPLAGAMNGITPVWAAEIEPYPIAVTRSRFPGMIHLGSVTDIDGGKIPPVDIITFGSPCQDMSIAGKRAGMKHEEKGDDETTRSGLFLEAVRIITEMRNATDGKCPTFAVWENVPGAFSSNNGADFQCVLETLCEIVAGGGLSIPRPSGGKWLNAGEIMADGWSLAWRMLDAQYWGVPQRRKRIFLVADFRGQRAGKILFERESLRGNPAQGGEAREETAADAGRSAFGSDGIRCLNPWDSQSERIYDPSAIHPCLSANSSGGQNRSGVVYALQGNGIDRAESARFNGCGWRENACYTLNTIDRPAVVFMAGQGAKSGGIAASDIISPTLKACPSGLNQVPSVVFSPYACAKQQSIAWFDRAPTLRANGEMTLPGVCYPNIARTLTAEADASPCVDRGQNVVCVDCRNHSTSEISGTLQAKSNGGQSLNFINPVVYDARGNGDGNTCPTIAGDHENRVTDYTALAIGNGQLNQISMAEQSNTLDCMHDKQAILINGKLPGSREADRPTSPEDIYPQGRTRDATAGRARKYIVRRLTPLECSRLQGFPDRWADLEIIEIWDDSETIFWERVRKNHAAAMGKAYKPFKNTLSLVKWHRELHSDGAEYKMWGNGVALPCVYFVLGGIAEELMREESKYA